MKFDLDTSVFLKSFVKNPFKNFYYFLKLTIFVASLVLNKFLLFTKIDFSKLKQIKLFYLISLFPRAKYLKWSYFSYSSINNCKVSSNWFLSLPHTGWNDNQQFVKSKNIKSINIASKDIEVIDKNFFWDQIYDDPEDTMALHRFGWMLKLLVDKKHNANIKTLISFIDDWISNQKNKKNTIAWESYSVSERIVNWLFFLCAIKPHVNLDNKLLQKISAELFKHLKYLALNLEYRGEKTNNHIINNARALYISGRLLNVKFSEKIAKSIIYNETDKLLKNGVLNEGSSHYQFLVTKNYLEIFWVAIKTKDYDFESWLNNRMKNMLDCCNYLGVEKNNKIVIPFIGDISPDSSPSWLMGYPFNYSKNQFSQWSKLWGNFDEFDKLLMEKIGLENDRSLRLDKKNQWLKISNSSSAIYSIVKNKSIKSHVHQDEGSFVFFYKDNPLIIDPGLKNYLKDDKISRDQLHANSHNSITINGCGIFPPRTSWMSKADIGGISKASLSKDLLHFEMTGFNCLGKSIGWNRKIDTSYNLLKVSDKISSSKSDLIKIIYIFNDTLSFVQTEDKILIKSGNEDLAFKIKLIDKERNNINDGKYKIYDSFMSKKYGESNLCKTISYSFTANGPVKILSVLKKINVN